MSVLDEIDAANEAIATLQQMIYDGQNAIRQEVADGLLQMKDQAAADLEHMRQQVADGLDELRKETAAALAALDERANVLVQALEDAQARSFTLKLASGREVVVSERDALQLFAALPICLRRQTAQLELASGQTEDFKMTDLEQLADAIVAANFHQPTNGAAPGAAP